MNVRASKYMIYPTASTSSSCAKYDLSLRHEMVNTPPSHVVQSPTYLSQSFAIHFVC
jgi:hypothetical protein